MSAISAWMTPLGACKSTVFIEMDVDVVEAISFINDCVELAKDSVELANDCVELAMNSPSDGTACSAMRLFAMMKRIMQAARSAMSWMPNLFMRKRCSFQSFFNRLNARAPA